jgi:hypothetical protein
MNAVVVPAPKQTSPGGSSTKSRQISPGSVRRPVGIMIGATLTDKQTDLERRFGL